MKLKMVGLGKMGFNKGINPGSILSSPTRNVRLCFACRRGEGDALKDSNAGRSAQPCKFP